jgi:glyoxylase-like metal-dependent hydrolase (beta-lactamase superfamily II)
VSQSAITAHTTASGVKIYRLPVQVFPSLLAYVHVVIAGDYVALIDTGSGLGMSNTNLREGFAALRSDWNEPVEWADITRIVITHAHIDHYGGLTAVRALSKAPIAVHALDRRVLVNHRERLTLATRAIAEFLRRAGTPTEQHIQLMQMYGWSKEVFTAVDVADTLEHGDLLDGLMQVYHTPGHCPGQICLRIDDVLLTADHVLPRTAVFLSPESITPSTGAEHYLQSLRAMAQLTNVRLALGGHEEPIEDYTACIQRIDAMQRQRLDRVREASAEPHTIHELTRIIYPELAGYDWLMALQKIGAYVEYLDQRGELAVENLDLVAADEQIAPRYRRL